MISIPLKDIISKIAKQTDLGESEIQQKIKAKIEQLYGLVSEEGAAHIVANEYGIKLFEVPRPENQRYNDGYEECRYRRQGLKEI
jgi:hypothetical protein